MGKITITLTDEEQAIAEEMASNANVSVKNCLSRLLVSRINHYAAQRTEQLWSKATPEQKQAAVTVLSKGAKKDGNKKQKATKKKAG